MLLRHEDELEYVEHLRAEGVLSAAELAQIPEDVRQEAERRAAERAARLAPAESLRLPPLLEYRRQEFGIPNGAFRLSATYTRVLAWQISQYEGQQTFGDTRILMPQVAQARERNEAPRAVIVSAGLGALDHLRSNGMDLGHIVALASTSPYRLRCDVLDGKAQYLLILASGDLFGSEDTRRLERLGVLKERTTTVEGAPAHYWETGDVTWRALEPARQFDE